jgi:hypothetical protein
LRVRVDAVDHGAVDPDRRVRARVIAQALVVAIGPPQRAPRVPALDAAVEIVPVVQEPPLEARALGDVEPRRRLAGLEQPQEMKRAVQRARLSRRRDHGGRVAADRRRANDVALLTEARERAGPAERSDRRRCRGSAHDDRAVRLGTIDPRHLDAQHPVQSPPELGGDRVAGRRPGGRYDFSGQPPLRRQMNRIAGRRIAEPEVVPGLGAKTGAERQDEGYECGTAGVSAHDAHQSWTVPSTSRETGRYAR